MGGEPGGSDAALAAMRFAGGDLRPQWPTGPRRIAQLRDSSRTRSASIGNAGAYGARNRCASSDAVLVMPGSARHIWRAADLDVDLVAQTPPNMQALELGLMRRVGGRQPTRERPPLSTGELAGSGHHRDHVGLGRRNSRHRPADVGRWSSRCDQREDRAAGAEPQSDDPRRVAGQARPIRAHSSARRIGTQGWCDAPAR